MRATGSATPTDLAHAIGLTGFESPRRVKRWLDGQNEPNYAVTLRLLELCGMLAVTAAAPAQEDGRPEGRVVALDARSSPALLSLLEALTLGQERLEAAVAALSHRLGEGSEEQVAPAP